MATSDSSINILIQAKDQASKVVAQAAKNINDSTESNNNAAQKNNGLVDKLGSAWLRMSAVAGTVAGVVSNVVNRAFNEMTALIGNAVSRVDTLNNFPRIMQNFGVGAEDATRMIKQLDQGVRGLPTTLNSIVELSEGFVPLTKTTDEAAKTALALNNAILAGGTPMQIQTAALEQFRQALSKGKPDLQDWKTIEMAMPAQLQQIAEKLGIGSGKLKDYRKNGLGLYESMKDGYLTMDDFNKALISLNETGLKGFPSFAQQAKNATQGISTGFTNAKTSVTRGIADIVQAIGASNISNAMSAVGSSIERVFKGVATALENNRGFIKTTAEKLDIVLSPSFGNLWKVLTDKVIPALTNLWHKVIEPMVPAFSALFVGALKLSIDTLAVLADVFAGFVGWVTDNRDFLAPIIGALAGLKTALMLNSAFAAATAVFTTFTTVTIPAAATAFGGFATVLSTPLVMPAIAIGAALAAIAAVWDAYNKMQTAIEGAKRAQDDLMKITMDTNKHFIDIYYDGVSSKEAKARAKDFLHKAGVSGFATGGYTGRGPVNEPAGIVHKGEYVVPASQVDQTTGQPKISSPNIHVTQNFYNQLDYDRGIKELGFIMRRRAA